MPIYLVRWPDLSAALVSAEDEDRLVDLLDELANPDHATWTEYTGPLWVEFEVPAEWDVERPGEAREPLRPEQIRVRNVDRVEVGTLEASVAGSETGSAMVEAIYRGAFPRLGPYLYRRRAGSPPTEKVRAIVHEELLRQVQANWKDLGVVRQDDPISFAAAQLNTSRRWVEQSLRAAGKLPPKKPATPAAVRQLAKPQPPRAPRRPRKP